MDSQWMVSGNIALSNTSCDSTKNVAMSILHCYHKLKDDHIEAIIHEGLYDLGT